MGGPFARLQHGSWPSSWLSSSWRKGGRGLKTLGLGVNSPRTPPRSPCVSGWVAPTGRVWRKARLAVCLGLDFMTADGAVASPGDPRQRCESPRRVHCCSGPALGQKTLKRGAPAPEFADGLDGRGSSRRRKSEGSSLPRLPGAGGPARPYLGGRVRGSDGRVPWRSRRRLRRGAAATGLGFGRRRAPSLWLLRAPLLRGAPGSHGFSEVLPRPAAGLRLLQIAGTRNRAKEAVRPEVPRAPSSAAPPPNAPSLRMKETRSRQTP